MKKAAFDAQVLIYAFLVAMRSLQDISSLARAASLKKHTYTYNPPSKLLLTMSMYKYISFCVLCIEGW